MTKKNIYALLTILFGVAMIVPMFLNLWDFSFTIGNNVDSIGQYGLFADYESAKNATLGTFEFNSVFALIVDIALVVATVALVAYVLLIVLDLAKIQKKYNYGLAKKVCGFAVILAAVVAIVFGIVFIAVNRYDGEIIKVTYSVSALAPYYIAMVGMVGTGVCAILSATGTKSAKRKRK